MSGAIQSRAAQQGFGRRGPNLGAPTEKPKDGRQTLRRLLGYFRPELKYVIYLALSVVLAVAAGVIAPRLQSSVIDDLVAREFDAIPPILGMMLCVYIVNGVATLLQGFLSARLGQRVIYRLRAELFGKVINLPIPYLDSHSHGDLMSRMTNDAENVSNVISSSLSSLFSGVLTLIGTLVMMFSYSVPLTLLTCVTVLLSVLVTRVMSALMRRYYLKRQVLLGQLNGIVEEKVSAGKTVTAYNLQEATIRDFAETSDALTKTGIIADVIGNAMGPLMNMINNAA